MKSDKNFVLFDSIKRLRAIGHFNGSIISINRDNSIIFSHSIKISEDSIEISEALLVGFEKVHDENVAFTKKSDFIWTDLNECPIEFSVLIPANIMELYDEGQFSDTFPFTINMLHSAGLYLEDSIDHISFFKGEILKNPIGLVSNGFCIADRVSIDFRGDPVFYDCIIVGRDQNEDLKVTYDPFLNVKMDEEIVKYIIILGIEELKL